MRLACKQRRTQPLDARTRSQMRLDRWTHSPTRSREPVAALIGQATAAAPTIPQNRTHSAASRRTERPLPCRIPARNAGLPVTGVADAPLPLTSVTGSPAFRTTGPRRDLQARKSPAPRNRGHGLIRENQLARPSAKQLRHPRAIPQHRSDSITPLRRTTQPRRAELLREMQDYL